ncbi:MAG: alginate export family protein [Nitrospirota bacterium]
MKRFLAVFASLMLVLGFAVSAFAIHAEIPSETQAVVAKGSTQLTLGGEIRMRGWYLDNYGGDRRGTTGTDPLSPRDAAAQGWYDARVRLSIQADVTKNTTGFVMLESGTGATSDGYAWGRDGSGINSKSTANMLILQAWIQHKGSGLLGIPAGIKVGHMPLALGEKQFLDHTKFGDDAIVFFMDPTKELHIGLLTAKLTEGSTDASTSNDINSYHVLATYKLNKDNTIGINYTLVNNQTSTESDFQNLGLHANGKVAGLSYAAEFDTQFGDQTATVKYKGYGFLLNLGYKIDPVNIRVGYAYGSGDNNAADNKNKEFQATLGNDVHYTFVYEYTTRGAAGNQTLANTSGRSSGIANTSVYRLGLDVDVVKDLSASIDGFILRANKVTTGSKKIGSEVDLKLTYKIDRNLTYSITAGYLDTGKWWEDTDGVTAANNKNITQVMHALTLSF